MNTFGLMDFDLMGCITKQHIYKQMTPFYNQCGSKQDFPIPLIQRPQKHLKFEYGPLPTLMQSSLYRLQGFPMHGSARELKKYV